MKSPNNYKNDIQKSGKTIYSPIDIGDPNYWIPTHHMEALLNESMQGCSLAGYALRTRSKIVKSLVCQALGYPIPTSFRKVQPRFPGQQLDTYAQKSLNLQIWNEDLSPTRRYAIIQVLEDNTIGKVRVVNGQELALLDKTGTVTTKYQARLVLTAATSELISPVDTPELIPHTKPGLQFPVTLSPVDEPESKGLLPIQELFQRLLPLVGQSFPDPGIDQERNRGAMLHEIACRALGYSRCEDTGQFPDIKNQLLELKLQASPTIDLGLVEPSSECLLDAKQLGNTSPRHCDTRYALFYARTTGEVVTLTHLFLTTGAQFFARFPRFGGRVLNGKIQIPLPRDFFV